LRLGIYMDLEYTAREGTVYTDEAVIRFIGGLTGRVEELTLFGRFNPEPAAGPYPVPPEIRLRPLPYYDTVANLRGVGAAGRRSCEVFRDELAKLDAVWLFGPHPLSLAFVAVAGRRGTPVFLGIRQDFPRYIAGRLPNRLWSWAVPAAWSAEWAYRRLARRLPTVVVGEDLARKYRAGRGDTVLATGFSLIRADDLVPLEQALDKPWDGELRVLNVGRLGPEKNPTLLPEILDRVHEHDDRWRLAVAGEGPLVEAVRERADELGVDRFLELLGYVPNGPLLRDEYRRSQAFLHVSFTEGLPQVIFEAQAAGLPIVATDVGGVADALGNGTAGLLVPPGDALAAAQALRRLEADEELRRRLIAEGHERARGQTMDAQLDSIVAFMRGHLGR
jgi:glycosyltransferase involved in cell wall biosynthesis